MQEELISCHFFQGFKAEVEQQFWSPQSACQGWAEQELQEVQELWDHTQLFPHL